MVRKLLGALSLTMLALAGTTGTAAAEPSGSDSVSGDASDCLFFSPDDPTFCGYSFGLDLAVESGPKGQNPSGDVDWGVGGFTPGGSGLSDATATCLFVNGRVAIIGVSGHFEQFGISNAVYPIAGLVRVVDAGGPDSGADTVEFALQTGARYGPPLPGPKSCSTFPGGFPPGGYFHPNATNETGDLVVSDTPASKEECKGGGWKTFGVFKNQGDCVSFMVPGGKNPPGATTH
jgi:hypothetical protein